MNNGYISGFEFVSTSGTKLVVDATERVIHKLAKNDSPAPMLMAQYEIMLDHRTCVQPLYKVGRQGYAMPYCEHPLCCSVVDQISLPYKMYEMLLNDWWTKPSLGKFTDYQLFIDYILEIIRRFKIDDREWAHMMDYTSDIHLEYCDTHGDPTIENTVWQLPREGLKFIDPIPERSYIPPCPHSDVGKILQSLYGYERVIGKFTYESVKPTRFISHLSEIGWSQAGIRFALLMCYAHVLRCFRYQPPIRHQGLRRMLTNIYEDFVMEIKDD